MVDDSALTANLTIAPGYKIPGWSETAEATAEFKNDGGLECPLPGCNRLFKDVLHGRRYTAERWKAHVLTREAHTYLWYNPERCYQPRSLENTFIRVDRRYRIAVCHFRREPVSPKKFDDHCRRCQKCIAVQHEFDNDDDFRSITYVSEQVIKREKMAVYGFEPCYAYFCCSRLHGINQQSMYIHSQTPGNHNPSNLIKCLRYRTSRHGYAYNPVSDYDFEMADMVTDGMMVTTIEDQPHGGAPQLSTVAAASSSSPVDPESSTSAEVRAGTPQEGQLLPIPVAQQWAQDLSLSTMPLSRAAFQGVCNEHGIGLFKQFYSRLISNCISRLDDATWNLHNDVVARWDIKQIYDETSSFEPGYSFMADQRNVFYFDKGGLRPEIVLASEDDSEIPPVIRNLCMHPRSATAIPLKESETLTVQAYFAQAEELLMAISVLIYTLLPEPPSVTQILNALYANIETRKRTIVIKSNRVVFMFSNREITLPWIMSSILVRYLTVVRALQVYLAEQLGYGEGSLQRMRSLLVANYAMGTSESLFSAQTKELTQLYIGIAVDEKAWAAVISQFYEGKKSSDSYAAGFKEWYDMIGLSSASLDTWPQLGMKSILPL